MKILQLHNEYALRGGEDTVVEQEKKLLIEKGHEVVSIIERNAPGAILASLKSAFNLRSNANFKIKLESVLRSSKPDVCHVHNVFWNMSPGIYSLIKSFEIPLVQTLHNYRLFCVNSYFYRDDHSCEDCLVKGRSQSLKHRCYDGSLMKTFFMYDAIDYHWKKGTWTHSIDSYICLSEFARKKFVEGGIPAEKLVIKPNFVTPMSNQISDEGFFLFVGRFTKEKGAKLIKSLAKKSNHIIIKVIGDNDLADLRSMTDNIDFLGSLPHDKVTSLISKSRAVLFTSELYEGMPMGIIEAFASKKPVIAKNHGAMSSMIAHGVNGLLYDNFEQLVLHVDMLFHNKKEAQKLGEQAYATYKSLYTPETNYDQLIDIYNKAINESRKQSN
jgi:glycosyltransferase involved in cell wall biosynthesis